MTTLERLDHDFKKAMKAKQEATLATLRMVRTALKNKQIELQRELGEMDVAGVLKTMLKQYQDAFHDFTQAGRKDLMEKQQREIDLIQSYLPEAMPVKELERLVREAVQETDAKDVGRAMGAAMKVIQGRADGTEVRKIVEKILSESS